MAGRTVSMSEVISAARARKVPLAPESAGYLALAVADGVLRTGVIVDPTRALLDEDGGVRVDGGENGSESEIERSIRELLGRLLASAGASTPSLADVASTVEERGVPTLVSELEAALIPANRSAAKRALARVFRETERTRPHVETTPKTASKAPPPPLAAPAIAPPVAESPTNRLPEVAAVANDPTPIDTSVAIADAVAPTPTPSVAIGDISMPIDVPFDPTALPPAAAPKPIAMPPADDHDEPPPGPPSSVVSFVDDLPADSVESEKPRALPMALLGTLLFVGVVALIAVWVLFPGFFTGHR